MPLIPAATTGADLATLAEQAKNDDQRAQLLSGLDEESAASLETYCPALIVLARMSRQDALRQKLRELVERHLASGASRIVRKTCAYILKTYYLTSNEDAARDFFELHATLDEAQFHIVSPVLEKLSILAEHVAAYAKSSLTWRHVRSAFLLALRHTNGWVRLNAVERALKLPATLLVNDLDFVIDAIYRALSAYDVYWRAALMYDNFDKLLVDMREFALKFDTPVFYVRLLGLFTEEWPPAASFFVSLTLPQYASPCFTADQFPLFRRVIAALEHVQYRKLRLSAQLNFANFMLLTCIKQDDQTLHTFAEMLPAAVFERMPAAKDASDLTLSLSAREAVPSEPDYWVELCAPQALTDKKLAKIVHLLGTDNSLAPHLGRVNTLLPTLKVDYQAQILRAMHTMLKDVKRCSLFPIVAQAFCEAIVAANRVEFTHREALLDDLFLYAKLNVQIAFVIARVLGIGAEPMIDTAWCGALVRLATIGEIPRRSDEVTALAHARALDFGLDSIHNYDVIARRTREVAIAALVRKCLDNADPLTAAYVLDVLMRDWRLTVAEHGKNSFGLSYSHRLKTRYINLVLFFYGNNALYKQLEPRHNREIQQLAMDAIKAATQQHSTRMPCEWLLTLCISRDRAFFEHWLGKSTELAETRIRSVVSWILSLIRYARGCVGKSDLRRVALAILPYVTAQNFSLRATAVAALRTMHAWHCDFFDNEPTLQFVQALASFDVHVTGNTQTAVRGICGDPYVTQLDANADLDLHTLFFVLPKLAAMPPDELLFYTFEYDFSKDEQQRLMAAGIIPQSTHDDIDYAASCVLAARGESIPPPLERANPTTRAAALRLDDDDDAPDVHFGVQRKLDTATQRLSAQPTLPDETRQLVVVATLVNKAANLGGLCRTCEVFNATELIIGDANIVRDENFKALSMSAEKWLPITQLKPIDVADYLSRVRASGFTVVAAEQTSRSTSLERFAFPAKTCLLLGEERQGIPPQLLRCVDVAVEICQLGHTRSLNVHVTASLFIHAYTVQHFMPSDSKH